MGMESLSEGSARVLERNRCSQERERGLFPEGTILNEEGGLKKINRDLMAVEEQGSGSTSHPSPQESKGRSWQQSSLRGFDRESCQLELWGGGPNSWPFGRSTATATAWSAGREPRNKCYRFPCSSLHWPGQQRGREEPG